MEYFVAPGGNDTNPGSQDRPFRTAGQGISVLLAGDVLNLRQGVYVGPVSIAGKHGTAANPIVIRSYPGEAAYLDGSFPGFRQRGNADWVPGRQLDPQAVDDEYISAAAFAEDLVNRGAFGDRNPYTRLVTYSRLEDLRAANETFDRIAGADPRPGPDVTDSDGNPLGHRHPWVYMGPGLFFNAGTRRVHIRLAHTHNGLPNVTDYDEETDPRRVSLAISHHDMVTVSITNCSHLRLERLTIEHGGDNTIVVQQTSGLTLDHVRMRAGTRAIRIGSSADVVLAHCLFDGGVPTWMFRSDRTGGYFFRSDGDVVANNLGEKTSEALLLGSLANTSVEIHHCDFVAGHRVFLEGQGVDFHHNWLSNVQDEALSLGFDGGTAETVTTIHDNVINRVSTALSLGAGNQATRWRIYRNLIDLRGRIRGTRPREAGDRSVWTSGRFHSGAQESLAPHDIFHNTVVVSDRRGPAAFSHFEGATGSNPRRCFNNIFVSANPGPDADIPITIVASPAFPGPSDGNLFHRTGRATADAFRHAQGTFAGLAELHASDLFEQSKAQYPPGYEAGSQLTDPMFVDADSDLRLSERSPALAAGIRLPVDLAALDPLHPPIGRPDIGCYAGDSGPLHVGVDGCRSFPELGARPIGRPRRLTAGGGWKPVFLHRFQDGDPSNLQALPGELTLVPDGLEIHPTPDPHDRGLLMAPGNRLMTYRLAQPLENVIGIDVSFEFFYPDPNPFTPAVVPLIFLNPGAMTLSFARVQPEELRAVRMQAHVSGEGVSFDGIALPFPETFRTSHFRARWHTHGQVHLWLEGDLRAYQPGVAAGRALTVSELVIGYPGEEPRFSPRYVVRGVLVKVLQRDETRDRFGGQIPVDTGCRPALDCVAPVAAVVAEMQARVREFITGFTAAETRPWRHGDSGGFQSARALAAQAAATEALRSMQAYFDGAEPDPTDAYAAAVGDFGAALSASDPAGYAALLAGIRQLAEGIDPACRRSLEPLLARNAAGLEPLVRMLTAASQRLEGD